MLSNSKMTSRFICLFILALIYCQNGNSQRIRYYRYVPFEKTYVYRGLQGQKNTIASRQIKSYAIESARDEYFDALRINSPDLDDKEAAFYNALFVKDMYALQEKKLSRDRFDGRDGLNIHEYFFGQIDYGIHPYLTAKFNDFVDAYSNAEYRLTDGKITLDAQRNWDIFIKALEASRKEYVAYTIARDLIEFERAGIRWDGEDRNKFRIIGLLCLESDDAYYTYEEYEAAYNKLIDLFGRDQLNYVFDMFNDLIYSDEQRYGLKPSKSLMAEPDPISMDKLSRALRTLAINDSRAYTISILEKYGSRRDYMRALELFKQYESFYSDKKMKIYSDSIFIREKVMSHIDYEVLANPIKLESGNRAVQPLHAFNVLIGKNDLGGFGRLIFINDHNREQTISDLKKKYGTKKYNSALTVALNDSRFVQSRLYAKEVGEEAFMKIINRKDDDFYEDEVRLFHTSGEIRYYTDKTQNDKSILNLYTRESWRTNPQKWSNTNNKQLYDINNVVCRNYDVQNLPEKIKIIVFLEKKIVHEYFFLKSDNFLVVYSGDTITDYQVDITDLILDNWELCIFDEGSLLNEHKDKIRKQKEEEEEEKKEKIKNDELSEVFDDYKKLNIESPFHKAQNIKERIEVYNKWASQIENEYSLVKKVKKYTVRKILILDDFFESFFGVTFKDLEKEQRAEILSDLKEVDKKKKLKKKLNQNSYEVLKQYIGEEDKSHKFIVWARYKNENWVRNQYKSKLASLNKLIKSKKRSSSINDIERNSNKFYYDRVLPSEVKEFKELVQYYKDNRYKYTW